jgi:hypothetical protein
LILVISHIANEAAPELVKSFPPGAALLLTASGFHRSFKGGISVTDFPSSEFFIDDRKFKPDEITGVITTIPGFFPVEFYEITPADREYVCAEVNAFFIYFLSALDCRKINPPMVKHLTGLDIQKPEWVKIAESLKIPVSPFRVKNGKYEFNYTKEDIKLKPCTIIGDRVIEDKTDKKIRQYVQDLANHFSLLYLRCYFALDGKNNYSLADIDSIPDISNKHIRQAITDFFRNS